MTTEPRQNDADGPTEAAAPADRTQTPVIPDEDVAVQPAAAPEKAKKRPAAKKAKKSPAAAKKTTHVDMDAEDEENGKKKRKKKHSPGYTKFGSYIKQILQAEYPDLTLSTAATNSLNSFVEDFIRRITDQSRMLMDWDGVQTMTSVQAVVSGHLLYDEGTAEELAVAAKEAIRLWKASDAAAAADQ
jgi:hypothetical protein